jgi:outer membrane protein TolC
VTEAAQVLALTKLGRSQAEANFQMQKTMFQLGVVTNMELLSAQNALNSALNDDLNAEYDYYLAVSALYHAIGETDQFLLEVGDNL